jgi:hypothetical protein
MGLAISVVYSAAYFVVSAVALVLSYFAVKGHPDPDERTLALRFGAYVGGIVASLAVAVLIAFAVLGGGLSDFFASAAIMLLVPVSLGTALLAGAKLTRGNRAAIVGWLSAGALHGTLITPFVAKATHEMYTDIARAQFDKLCTQADVQLLEQVPPAKSLTMATYLGPQLEEMLLLDTTLLFVERVTNKGPTVYVRLSKASDWSTNPKSERSGSVAGRELARRVHGAVDCAYCRWRTFAPGNAG